jgi:crotonobetaine/carnitine-CoA ligase
MAGSDAPPHTRAVESLSNWTTLAARWSFAATAAGDATVLEVEGAAGEAPTTWTYGAFSQVVEDTRATLAAHGLQPGDRVQLLLPNCPAFIAVMLACATSGWIMLPTDPRGTPDEIGRQTDRVLPSLVVCGSAQLETYRATGRRVPVVSVDPTDIELAGLRDAGRADTPTVAPAPLDTLGLMFTSGTTSAPKIVEVTQANYAFAGDVMAAAGGLRRGSRFLVVLPLFHANAQYYSVSASIAVGATVVLTRAFSASRFVDQAEQFRATHASLFAAPMRMILSRARPTPLSRPLENVWFSQNLTEDEYERFAALVGCRPRQIYGMTETAPAVLIGRRLSPARTTVGTTTLGCHVRLRDPETGMPTVPGDVGQIQVGGYPGLSLFAGYRDNPLAFADATTAPDDSGFVWLNTGDLGRVRDDDDVEFVGRGGDMLKVAGENVSVVELESLLVEHDAVLDAAVVGIEDPVRDEVPIAFVVATDDAPADLASVLALWCAERLSGPRRPQEFHVVAELPRTAVGKIQRFRLQALAGLSRADT